MTGYQAENDTLPAESVSLSTRQSNSETYSGIKFHILDSMPDNQGRIQYFAPHDFI